VIELAAARDVGDALDIARRETVELTTVQPAR
jgi:hypothetical protein